MGVALILYVHLLLHISHVSWNRKITKRTWEKFLEKVSRVGGVGWRGG